MVKKNDYVEFHRNGARFTGTVTEVDEKHGEVEVTFSRGVSMLVFADSVRVIEEEDFDKLD